ncbi:MAG: enterochelin esterase [Pseudonocardiaceae bacterium]
MTQTLSSPRLVALRSAVDEGQPDALSKFWAQVTEQGAPLIEAIPDDDEAVTVTFLWRGAEPVDNVLVFGGPVSWDLVSNRMGRLEGTDVWHLTCRLPKGSRTSYRLAPNDPLSSIRDASDWRARTATWQPDPLNPRTVVFPKDDEIPDDYEVVVSLLELPGAPAQPWAASRPGVPSGALHQHLLRSEILDNDRRVWVHTPPGYTAGGDPYGLVVLFDGGTCRQVIPVPTILDNLLAEGLVPPLVAVLISNVDRAKELACHPPFADFLARELLPWLHERYHVTADPARTVVGGQSLGGLAAAYAALRYPEAFGNVLSQSGSFWHRPEGEREHEWLTRQYADTPRLPLRFFLEVGLLEDGATPDDGPSMIVVNRHLRTVLHAKGYEVRYSEYVGGHDYPCWRGTLADGLLALIGTAD